MQFDNGKPGDRSVTIFQWALFILSAACCFFIYGTIVLARFYSTYFYLLFLLLPLWLAGFWLIYGVMKSRRILDYLDRRWGEEADRDRDLTWLKSSYKMILEKYPSASVIDDQTWNDLNLNEVYSKLDRTFTTPGSNGLYRLLREPLTSVEAVNERKKWIDLLKSNRLFRESIALPLLNTGRQKLNDVTRLLWGNRPEESPYTFLFDLLALLALGSLFLFIKIGFSAILISLTFFGINFLIHIFYKNKTMFELENISYLKGMAICAQKLNQAYKSMKYPVPFTNKVLHKFLRKTAFLFGGGKGIASENIMDAMKEYLNIFFLLEVRAFHHAIEYIDDNIEDFRELYLKLAEIDAYQSIASFQAKLTSFCEPVWSNKVPFISFEDLYHPLITDPVSNSWQIKDLNGVVITGSNMAGKSTFLRTVGVNALFVQTIGIALAKRYETSLFRIISSISQTDNLPEGKSFYFAEAERLLQIINSSSESMSDLYIIDELLAGTNSEERLLASEAILKFLVKKNALVFVATHDLELSSRLNNQFECCHFTDNVSPKGLDFDYKLKSGTSTTRNAIKLLEYLGYPAEIINETNRKKD